MEQQFRKFVGAEGGGLGLEEFERVASAAPPFERRGSLLRFGPPHPQAV